MRTRDWMALNGVELGAMVELAFSELKVEDAGLVTTVASCPPIERDDACLVTGTFRHLNRDVMEVTFANSDLVIEPTWLHPLWSLDRDGWVRAGKLEPGERLKSEAGPLVVDTVRELPSSHVVYNLEVAGDHTYLVGADGLLSHNNEGCDYTQTGRIKKEQLPRSGKVRFIPPKNWDPNNPKKGDSGGFIDKFGNEWVKGPSRTEGEAFEWDVQLSSKGQADFGWASSSGEHINVSLQGEITH